MMHTLLRDAAARSGARVIVTTAEKVAAIPAAGLTLAEMELIVTTDDPGMLDGVVGPEPGVTASDSGSEAR